ncbi:MAG TPA: ABC transporter substrate-binding protein [Solirubrobacteraceae bacterium]|nr:ABC transporter substrate-binding protein [Solirubrobacteraceae bacterium]
MSTWRKPLLAALPLCCAVAIAACGSSKSSSSSASTSSSSAPASTSTSASSSSGGSANSAVVALVPSALKSKGTLTVAADASYAPDEFIGSDGHTVVGMDADLAKALAAEMGLKANVVNATFATIIPGLAAGRYDMGASSFSDTLAREKTVDFVDYAHVGESFYTKGTGGVSIGSIADICGKTVSVESGTTEQADAKTQSAKCTKAGKPAVNVLVFNTQTEANLAVSSGRAQLGFADTPVALYQVKQSGGEFKIVGAAYATGPYGLAIPKNGLDKAVLAALQDLVKNGTYKSILAKWGLSGIAIPASQVKINGATS